jgi:hypothetical protein
MPIRASSAAELRRLVDALESPEEVQRESAIARLAVLGARAAEHLLRVYLTETRPRTRAGLLQALEACAPSRVVPLARPALRDASPDVTSAAVGVLHNLLTSTDAATARDALDSLVATAIDRGLAADRRLAALDALKDLPASTTEPVRRTLASDPDPIVRQRAADSAPDDRKSDIWTRAIEGQLPASPESLRKAVVTNAASARLTELQRLVDAVRAREAREEDPMTRAEWRAARGALHQALAARGSRLALYDLRDSLLASERLPVAFLAALEEVGDASCLEPLAAAYDASAHNGDPWWRDHLAAAFRAIVHRENLTRRHAVVKRTMARWPDAAADLMARS